MAVLGSSDINASKIDEMKEKIIKSETKNVQEKEEMTALDIKYAIRELKFLIGSRIDTIYQNDDELRMKIYSPKHGPYTLLADSKRIHLTSSKKEPKEPSMFAMILRKHLSGRFINSINQNGFDRVVEICTPDRFLIIELFHDGNMILTDSSHKIIMPLRFQRWKDRQIIPKERYVFPSGPMLDDYLSLKRLIKIDKKIIAILHTIGFGRYAKEILVRAKLSEDKTGNELTDTEINDIASAIIDLSRSEINAEIICNNAEEPIDVIPFSMLMHQDKKRYSFESFNKALDVYFTEKENIIRKKEVEKKEKEESEKARQERILKQQEEAIETFEEKEKKERDEANLIYKNYELVENILKALQKAREKYEWEKIKEMIKNDSSKEANAIKEIKEHEGIVIVILDGEETEIKLNKSVKENAILYYEEAKKLKQKKEHALEAIEKTEERIDRLTVNEEAKSEQLTEETEPITGEETEQEIAMPQKQRKRWYHDYRYFWSIDGLLVVAGKDDTTNEMLIKKHTEPTDIVLHADIHGAPFVIIKERRDKREKPEELTPQGIIEAGEFAASYSKAWQMGLGSVDVYWIKPEQVIKLPELPKGSFQITGEKNYLKKIKLRLAIGINTERKTFIVGPVKSTAARCNYYVSIEPGNISAPQLAKDVKEMLITKALFPDEKDLIASLNTEEIEKNIPAGSGRLIVGVN